MSEKIPNSTSLCPNLSLEEIGIVLSRIYHVQNKISYFYIEWARVASSLHTIDKGAKSYHRLIDFDVLVDL